MTAPAIPVPLHADNLAGLRSARRRGAAPLSGGPLQPAARLSFLMYHS